MTLDTLLLPFIWVLNGFLAVVYLVFENFTIVALIPLLVWLWKLTPKAQQWWMAATAVLAVAAGILAPFVVGLWLLLMSGGSILAISLEKFNQESLSWRVISGIAAYALIGIGFSIYNGLSPALIDPYGTFAQGKGYLDILISLAVFLGPLGFVGLLVQSLFAHPPIEGTPEELVTTVRTRGRYD
jgi:hypothetical protein